MSIGTIQPTYKDSVHCSFLQWLLALPRSAQLNASTSDNPKTIGWCWHPHGRYGPQHHVLFHWPYWPTIIFPSHYQTYPCPSSHTTDTPGKIQRHLASTNASISRSLVSEITSRAAPSCWSIQNAKGHFREDKNLHPYEWTGKMAVHRHIS